MKILRLWAMVLTIVGLWSSSHAQENPDASFTFWVDTMFAHPFEQNGNFFLLDEEGRVLDTLNPYEDVEVKDFSRYRHKISPDGRRFAMTGIGGSFMERADYLVVYDTETDELLYEQIVADKQTTTLHFVDDDTLAYGIREAQTWALVILDIETGSVTHRLTDTDLSDFALDISANPYSLSPWIYTATSSDLLFVMRDRERGLQTFIWHYLTGEMVYLDDYLPNLNENIPYSSGIATPISGSPYLVIPKVDDRLLFAMQPEERYEQDPYQFGAGNAVHVLDISTGQHFPIYTSDEGTIQQVFPVQNGERLLVSIADDYQDNPRWLLLERDGRPVGTVLTGRIRYVFNIPDGFIFNTEYASQFINPEDNTPIEEAAFNLIYAYNTRTLTYHGYEHLQQEFDNQLPQSPDVIWSSASVSQDLTAFVPLMPPLPDETLQPEPLPLRVNGVAYVTVSGGDNLNMRDQPSVNGEITERLQNNQRVILLDGPVEADGFIWWDVWADRNVRGWIVQEAADEVTLRPPMNDQYEPITMAQANLVEGETGFAPLAVGMRVRVISEGVNVREQTGLHANVREVLTRNARMTIIGGSFEDDGLTWWQVMTDGGTEGWIAEVSPDGEITVAPDE